MSATLIGVTVSGFDTGLPPGDPDEIEDTPDIPDVQNDPVEEGEPNDNR